MFGKMSMNIAVVENKIFAFCQQSITCNFLVIPVVYKASGFQYS